ncbi:hypothetical protein HYY70_01115 [Candidatus Woesearchaeota archaeon]|nr:hypothetical protein [Candidatus Woesearchaeota archaeon]
MASGTSYAIGRLVPLKRRPQREVYDVQRELAQFLIAQGKKEIVPTVEGVNVGIYAGHVIDPVVSTIRAFMKSHEGWRFEQFSSSRGGDSDHAAEIETLKAENTGYRERISTLVTENGRYQRSARDRDGTIRELEMQIRDYESGIRDLRGQLAATGDTSVALLGTTGQRGIKNAENLAAVLTQDREIYKLGAQAKITFYLTTIAGKLSERDWYVFEQLLEAQAFISEKERYLREHGQAAVDSLPEIARAPILSRWEKAQAIVDEANRKAPPLEVLVHIRRTKDAATVIIPYDGTATNGVSSAFCESWKQFGIAAEERFGYKVEYAQDGLWSMAFSGKKIDYKALERLLFESFKDVAERARLTIVPFYNKLFMEYRIRDVKKTKVFAEPSEPIQEGEASDLHTYAKSRVRELGYSSLKALCDAKGASYGAVMQRLSGKKGMRRKSLAHTAKLLEVPESELSRRLPKKR